MHLVTLQLKVNKTWHSVSQIAFAKMKHWCKHRAIIRPMNHLWYSHKVINEAGGSPAGAEEDKQPTAWGEET